MVMTSAEKKQNWVDFINNFFPEGVPSTKEWTGAAAIAEQLNKIGFINSKAYNHTFMPGGGGLDLQSAKLSTFEPGCIEVDFDGCMHVIKPAKLIFHSFDSDYEWFYFRLECDSSLKPSGVYPNLSDPSYEEVCRLPNGEYVDRGVYDHGYYGSDSYGNPLELPRAAKVVARQMSGSFVTFGKFSRYNQISGTYDGRHSKMTNEGFRQHIQSAVDYLKAKEASK